MHIDELAQQTPLGHVERVEFKEIIAAVLEHHHMQALAFTQVDERPNLVHVHGRGDLDGDMMAVLQRLVSHQEMV